MPTVNDKKVYFLEEVRRIENQLRDELRVSAAAAAATMDTASTAPSPSLGASRVVDGNSSSMFPVPENEIRRHLERHKVEVRLEAMAAVQRHREHLAAKRKAVNAA